jgi:hypothetical protein
MIQYSEFGASSRGHSGTATGFARRVTGFFKRWDEAARRYRWEPGPAAWRDAADRRRDEHEQPGERAEEDLRWQMMMDEWMHHR